MSRVSILLPAILTLAAAPCAAQSVPEDYMTLLRDAVQFEGGAHFAGALQLVARNTEGGGEAVLAALEADAPDLAETARAILRAELTADVPVTGESVAAESAVADAGTAAAAGESPVPAVTEARRRGLIGGLTHALFGGSDDPVWTGRLRAGLRLDGGNSDQLDYTLGLEAERALIGWGFRATLDYSYSEANDRISRDDFKTDLRAERELGERWTTFVRGEYRRDRLSSYEYTTFAGAGLGYRLFDTPELNWTLRAAPGLRYQKPDGGSGESGLAGDLTSELSWQAAQNLTLRSRSTVVLADRGEMEQTLGVTSRVGDGWAAEARYRYRYDFEPRPGFERTDRRLDLSVVKEF